MATLPFGAACLADLLFFSDQVDDGPPLHVESEEVADAIMLESEAGERLGMSRKEILLAIYRRLGWGMTYSVYRKNLVTALSRVRPERLKQRALLRAVTSEEALRVCSENDCSRSFPLLADLRRQSPLLLEQSHDEAYPDISAARLICAVTRGR